MKVQFFEPPAAQRVGGLDAAIESLRAALHRRGVQVLDAASRERPDLVHFHGLWQIAHSRRAAELRGAGIPYLVSPHGMLEPWAFHHKWWKKWPYLAFIERKYLAAGNAVLATGRMESERLRKFLPKQRIEALPLGLTGTARPDYRRARQALHWSPEEVVLLFLSRLHVKKGPDLLLRALASIKWPAVTRLVIVGDGDTRYVAKLKQFAAENAGRLPRIDWVGAMWGEARWKYFQGADLFCLPTHSENFGLAVLEACQVGTLPLTTMDTPWADVLQQEDRGLLTLPKVEELRESLSVFFARPLQSEEQRKARSDWAWRDYDWEKLGERYAAFYRSVQSAPARATAV